MRILDVEVDGLDQPQLYNQINRLTKNQLWQIKSINSDDR